MREQVFLLCVITLLQSASGKIAKKNCDDCTLSTSCQAANILILKHEEAANDQLREAFCGYDNHYNMMPKVCCSMFSNAELTSPGPGVDSIDRHPNLQLLPETCGVTNPKYRLWPAVELNDYPWMALIAYKTKGLQFQCSGSLINERYVLTAAHCISHHIAGVRIGEFNLETETDCLGIEPNIKCGARVQDLRVEEAIIHPDYRRNLSFNNDIGILRLKKPVNLTFENAKTICLPVTKDLQDRNVSGLDATIAGWGISETGSMSAKLDATDIPIHTQDHCSAEFNRKPEDSIDFTKKLCAGGDDRSTRIADDGGPLMVGEIQNGLNYFIQYGIYSVGSQSRGSSVPTVYTDVSKYMKWILDTIRP